MDVTGIKIGLVLDGHIYVPAPMKPACKGCDLLEKCQYGERYICEFIDKLTGQNNMFKKFKEE